MSKDLAGWLNYAHVRMILVRMPKLLSETDIKSRLTSLKGWKREKSFITKTFEFDSFMSGIRFVDKLAEIAEEKEHHPDIHLRYTKIKLSIQTHSAGGVTGKDFDLAAAIDQIQIR